MGLLSNYCGLGGLGKVQDEVDQICKEHDEDYETLRKKKINPYIHFNDADRAMIDKLEKILPSRIQGKIIKQVSLGIWKFKEHFMPHDNTHIEHSGNYITPQKGKRKREPKQTPQKNKRFRPIEYEVDSTGKAKRYHFLIYCVVTRWCMMINIGDQNP